MSSDGKPWLNGDGLPLVDEFGVPIWCDKCPCKQPVSFLSCGWVHRRPLEEYQASGEQAYTLTLTVDGFDSGQRWGTSCSPPYDGDGWRDRVVYYSLCSLTNGTYVIDLACHGEIVPWSNQTDSAHRKGGMFCGTNVIDRIEIFAGWQGSFFQPMYPNAHGKIFASIRWYTQFTGDPWSASTAWVDYIADDPRAPLVDDPLLGGQNYAWDPEEVGHTISGTMTAVDWSGNDGMTYPPACTWPSTINYSYTFTDLPA